MIVSEKTVLAQLRNGDRLFCASFGKPCFIGDATSESWSMEVRQILESDPDAQARILVSDLYMLEGYVQRIPEVVDQLVAEVDTPMKLVFAGVKNLPPSLRNDDDRIGFQIVSAGVLFNIIQRFRKPILLITTEIMEDSTQNEVFEIDLEEAGSILKFEADGSFKILKK